MAPKDYTAWPHLILTKNLIGFSIGHHERGPLKQICFVMFLSKGIRGHVVGGVYDKATS